MDVTRAARQIGVPLGHEAGHDAVLRADLLDRFFHGNLVHRSDQNRSPNRRWTVLFCYNAARNNPYLEHHHPQYTPLHKVDDSAVKLAGVRYSENTGDYFRKNFANPPELKKTMQTS